MGEIGVAKNPNTLTTTLGSCIGIVLIDSKENQFGLVHVMLPKALEEDPKEPGRYADTGIVALLKEMDISSPRARKLKAVIAGGANMFQSTAKSQRLGIGENNMIAVKEILKEMGIPILGEDLGGTKGRKLRIDTEKQVIFVSQIGEGEKELWKSGQAA